MYKNILQLVDTEEEAEELLSLLNLIKKGELGINELSDKTTPVLSGDLLTKIVAELSANDNKKSDTIQELINAVSEISILKLVLAYSPRSTAITTLARWAKQNIGYSTAISISHDPSLVGGAQVMYMGSYKDYSLRKLLTTKN